jgi:hypothetical protein
MAIENRRVVPIKEAIRRIGRRKMVHTFMQGVFALLGADHERDGLIEAMRTHGVEDSGDQASSMGHTLVIVKYPTWDGRTTPLFIEAKPADDAVAGSTSQHDPSTRASSSVSSPPQTEKE